MQLYADSLPGRVLTSLELRAWKSAALFDSVIIMGWLAAGHVGAASDVTLLQLLDHGHSAAWLFDPKTCLERSFAVGAMWFFIQRCFLSKALSPRTLLAITGQWLYKHHSAAWRPPWVARRTEFAACCQMRLC